MNGEFDDYYKILYEILHKDFVEKSSEEKETSFKKFSTFLDNVKNYQHSVSEYLHETLRWWQSQSRENFPNPNPQLYTVVEQLLQRGADPNFIPPTIFRHDFPILFLALEGEEGIVELLLKSGADVHKGYFGYFGHQKCTIIEHMLYRAISLYFYLDDKEAIIKILVKWGASTDIPRAFHSEKVYYQLQLILQKINYEAKIAELEADLKEAKDYIFELEHRPPELGGPEYEDGLKRWEERSNSLSK